MHTKRQKERKQKMPVIVVQVYQSHERDNKKIIEVLAAELAKFAEKIGVVAQSQISFLDMAKERTPDTFVIVGGAEDALSKGERKTLQENIRAALSTIGVVSDIVVTSPREKQFK